MANVAKQSAVGDAAATDGQATDPHGARTAVGVPHPENRPEGQSLPAVDLSEFELDDYDDDKQRPSEVSQLPPDEDAGESFSEIVDVGETPEQHHQRAENFDTVRPVQPAEPMVDNQTNQPERFHNPPPKPETGSTE